MPDPPPDPIDEPTPGPWAWELHPDNRQPIALAANDGDVILATGDDRTSYMVIASPADMAAIEAVPDLLDACKAAVQQLDYLQSLWGKEAITDRLARTLRAAVAKATGAGASTATQGEANP